MKFRINFKIWLEDEDGNYVLGMGTYQLLMGIKECGSITAAAKAAGMSYDYAWKKIRALERAAGTRLVERKRGGPAGGGAVLTPEGECLVAEYQRALERAERTVKN